MSRQVKKFMRQAQRQQTEAWEQIFDNDPFEDEIYLNHLCQERTQNARDFRAALRSLGINRAYGITSITLCDQELTYEQWRLWKGLPNYDKCQKHHRHNGTPKWHAPCPADQTLKDEFHVRLHVKWESSMPHTIFHEDLRRWANVQAKNLLEQWQQPLQPILLKPGKTIITLMILDVK